jgi:hypothetical protein
MPRRSSAVSDSRRALRLSLRSPVFVSTCPGNLLDSPLWTQGSNALFKRYARNYGAAAEETRRTYTDRTPRQRGRTCADVCNVIVV